ncbi:PDZ domain-containing protein [Helicobacter japonicus]|uniref:PDZ domain-containing protein n=1 Tax=Helicobacter japonicus TaxID=425400 RepID=UPI003F4B3B68
MRFASNKAIVSILDPFSHNSFQVGDEILSINGTKPHNSNEAEWLISNLKKGSLAKVLVKRNGKTLQINAKVNQRYGGFLLKESFLERFGIHLDDNMVIQSINPALAGRFSELRANDKIIWINKEPIITESTDTAYKRFERLKYLLSKTQFDERFEGKIQLLIMRDNLEIFIKV